MVVKENSLKNLKPKSTLTSEEAKRMGSVGGKKSVEVRRKKKIMSEIYAAVLSNEYEIKDGDEITKVSGEKLLGTVIADIVKKRDSSSVSMIKELREGTEGNKYDIDIDLEAEVKTVDLTNSLSHEQKKKLVAEWMKKNNL